jgi:tyrosine decarboxylase/aspartate 1-decarboxylase
MLFVRKTIADLNVVFFREKGSNIITIKSDFITEKLATKYRLVPDTHTNPSWYKIVIMDDVSLEKLMPFMKELKQELE